MREIVFVFPGQGSQHASMLDGVPELDSFNRLLDAAEALSELPLCDIIARGGEGLTDTRVAQPLLYLVDWAWGVTLLESGVVPDAVAGHSLGELAALAIAGVFSAEAGLELVVERSRLMAETAERTPGGMAAVLGLSGDVVAGAIGGIDGVWVANDNAPGQVVISGTHEALDAARAALEKAGARRVVTLAVSGPFHSPLMAPAAERFGALLDQADFSDARFPVVPNALAARATAADELRAHLTEQIVSPVRWTETMATLAGHDEPTLLIEAGPGGVLRGLARRVDGLSALSVEDTPLETIVEEAS